MKWFYIVYIVIITGFAHFGKLWYLVLHTSSPLCLETVLPWAKAADRNLQERYPRTYLLYTPFIFYGCRYFVIGKCVVSFVVAACNFYRRYVKSVSFVPHFFAVKDLDFG